MGCPVVHWELWSEDPDTAVKFYAKVFDREMRHIPEMNYHLAETGGEGGINGGIMKPQQGPWTNNMAFYIDVDDLATYRQKLLMPVARSWLRKWRFRGLDHSHSLRIRMGGCWGCGSRERMARMTY